MKHFADASRVVSIFLLSERPCQRRYFIKAFNPTNAVLHVTCCACSLGG